MILISAYLAFFFVLFIPLGGGLYTLYTKFLGREYKASPDLFQLTWLGYALFIGFAQIYSLFFPINSCALIIVCAISLASFIISFRNIRSSYKYTYSMVSRYQIVTALCLVLLVAYISYCASTPPIHSDTELYHLNAVKWAHDFPAVPGIVHIHGRLACVSSFHLFAALTESWIWEDRAVYLTNAFLLLLASSQWLTYIVSSHQRRKRLHHPYLIITAPFLILFPLGVYFPSLSTDLPSYILCFVIGLELLSIRTVSWSNALTRKNLFSWFIILNLAAVAFTTKLSGAILLLVLVPVSLYLVYSFNQRNESVNMPYKHMVALYSLPLVIISGLIARNIILSGWLLYPFPMGNLHMDWSASQTQVDSELSWIKSWARMPQKSPEEVLNKGFAHWFYPWLSEFGKERLAILLLSTGTFGLFCLTYQWLSRKIKFIPFYLFLSILLVITGLAYWFLSAPMYRFGEMYFWMLAATCMSPIVLKLEVKTLYTLTIITIIAAGLKYKQDEFPHTYFYPHLTTLPAKSVPSSPIIPVIIKNGQIPQLTIYKPAEGENCGNSPLPCSPYIDENEKIESRIPGQLRSGFRSTAARGRN